METNEREITLTKQRSVSLKKGLSKLKVEIVWKPNSRALRSSNYDFDVDLITVELNKMGKCPSPDHLVFYSSILQTSEGMLTDPFEAVQYGGDNTGSEDESGDDGYCNEEVLIYPKKVDPNITDILFLVNIYDSGTREQTFKMIDGAEVRAYEDGKDIAKLVYKLDDDYKNDTTLVFGKLSRVEGNRWEFQALGEGSNQTLFKSLVKYGLKFKESDI